MVVSTYPFTLRLVMHGRSYRVFLRTTRSAAIRSMYLRLKGLRKFGITAQASVAGNLRTGASGSAGVIQKTDRVDPMVGEGA